MDPRFQKSVFTQLVKKWGSQRRDARGIGISQLELNYILQYERRSDSLQTLNRIVKENYLRFAGYPRRLVVTDMGLKWAGGGAA